MLEFFKFQRNVYAFGYKNYIITIDKNCAQMLEFFKFQRNVYAFGYKNYIIAIDKNCAQMLEFFFKKNLSLPLIFIIS